MHSWLEHRYRCRRCRRTFAATTGTPFHRAQTAVETITIVVTLLAYGCPRQAIVAALGSDERPVARWQTRAGAHCQQVHEHVVQQGTLDLGHVQADELWVKVVGGKVWLAQALAVPPRLWLGGVVRAHRDRHLIIALVRRVRACSRWPGAEGATLLVCVDGLAAYVTALRRAFRLPVATGGTGRARLALPATFLLGQVVKRYARAAPSLRYCPRQRVVAVLHRIRAGTPVAIATALATTHSGPVINTAYIERLNATFRSHLVPLVRRGRALARTEATLTAGRWLVGCAYNWCWGHHSLRGLAPPGGGSPVATGAQRTPAMAAGLTDHCWTMRDLLTYHVPLPAWVAPTRRGRPHRHYTIVTPGHPTIVAPGHPTTPGPPASASSPTA